MAKLEEMPAYEREHLLSKLRPPLGSFPWVASGKALSKKRIAIITTAGLSYRSGTNFDLADASYRAIPRDIDINELVMTHVSVNFDRSGFQEDINVVFPIERFHELEAQGVIGSSAAVHYSFMGGGLLPEAYEGSVRELAQCLKNDQVDAVMVLPVCPNCSRTVCAICHYLESEGIQTVGIALFREIAQAMQPPRISWVSFPLGRPLGRPNDSGFQREVITTSLALLDAGSGPVLQDYPVELPDSGEPPPPCPVSFKRNQDVDTWRGRIAAEVASLGPWYELGLQRRGRTTVGVSGRELGELIPFVTRWPDHPAEALPELTELKLALEDLKAFYAEAIMARPGDYAVGFAERIIFDESSLGALIMAYVEHFDANEQTRPFVRVLTSRESVGRSTGSWAVGTDGEIVTAD